MTIYGYLLTTSIGSDVSIPYADLPLISQATGFPLDVLPKPGIKNKFNAWEKATGSQTFPATGLSFNVGPEARNNWFSKLGIEPFFKLRMVRLKKETGSPIVKRQLILEVYTAIAESDIDNDIGDFENVTYTQKKKTLDKAKKQLGQYPIVLLEYNTEADSMRFAPTENATSDLTPAISALIDRIRAKIQVNIDSCDSAAIRASIRSYLAMSSAVQIQRTGTYLVPNLPEAKNEHGDVIRTSSVDKLIALKRLIESLRGYLANDEAMPTFTIAQAVEDEDDLLMNGNFAAHKDIVCDDIKGRINSILEKLGPVLDGSRSGKYSQNTTLKCQGELSQVLRVVEDLRESFQSQLSELDSYVQIAHVRMVEANKIAIKSK